MKTELTEKTLDTLVSYIFRVYNTNGNYFRFMFDFSSAKTETDKIDLLVLACTTTYATQRVFSISKSRVTTHATNYQYSTYTDVSGALQYKIEYLTVNQHYLFIHTEVAMLLDPSFLKFQLNKSGQVVRDVFTDFKTTTGVNHYNIADFVAIDCQPASTET